MIFFNVFNSKYIIPVFKQPRAKFHGNFRGMIYRFEVTFAAYIKLLWIARHFFFIFSTSKYYSPQNKNSYFFFVTLSHLIIWQNSIYCLVQDIGGQLWVSLQILLVAFEVIKKNVPALNDHFRFLCLALPKFYNPIQFNCTYGSNTISEFWAFFFPKVFPTLTAQSWADWVWSGPLALSIFAWPIKYNGTHS